MFLLNYFVKHKVQYHKKHINYREEKKKKKKKKKKAPNTKMTIEYIINIIEERKRERMKQEKRKNDTSGRVSLKEIHNV